MITDTERLEREIALEKVALTENLAALEVKTRELTDWRWQVRQRPLASVGVALAGGVVLAMLTTRRASRARRRSEAGDDRAAEPSMLEHPIVERLVAALAVLAAEKAVEVLSEMLPGLPAAMAKEEPLASAS